MTKKKQKPAPVIFIRADADLYAALKAAADADERSVHKYAERLLRAALHLERKKRP